MKNKQQDWEKAIVELINSVTATELSHNIDRVIIGKNKIKGQEHYKAKLSNKQVKKIRRLYKDTELLQREIADMFNVGQTSISHIVTKQVWKHI